MRKKILDDLVTISLGFLLIVISFVGKNVKVENL